MALVPLALVELRKPLLLIVHHLALGGLHSLLLCTTKAWMNDYREPWTWKYTVAARRQELVHADA
jgi:hypothetical protein